MKIESFRDRQTEKIYQGRAVRRVDINLQRRARRKMRQIDAAIILEDLRVPPGNHLEKLRGNRSGQYSIRVNNQYRICFRWVDDKAYDVEFVDYHD